MQGFKDGGSQPKAQRKRTGALPIAIPLKTIPRSVSDHHPTPILREKHQLHHDVDMVQTLHMKAPRSVCSAPIRHLSTFAAEIRELGAPTTTNDQVYSKVEAHAE
jgi:hypothetical protein